MKKSSTILNRNWNLPQIFLSFFLLYSILLSKRYAVANPSRCAIATRKCTKKFGSDAPNNKKMIDPRMKTDATSIILMAFEIRPCLAFQRNSIGYTISPTNAAQDLATASSARPATMASITTDSALWIGNTVDPPSRNSWPISRAKKAALWAEAMFDTENKKLFNNYSMLFIKWFTFAIAHPHPKKVQQRH